MSRNVTTTTDNISPVPRENNVAKQIGNTDKKIVHVIGVLVINITIINATNDVNIFTKDEHTLDNGNKYFGTYTFLIKGALSSTEVIAILLASLKKLNVNCPHIK